MDIRNKNSTSLTSSSAQSNQFQLISDDESLDDHSGLEDFQGVTLQINESNENLGPETESMTPEKSPAQKVITWNEPECNSTIGNNISGIPSINLSGSPNDSSNNMLSPFPSKGQSSLPNSNFSNYWRPQSPLAPSSEDSAREFFVFRDSIIQNAIDDLQSLADHCIDGEIRRTWLFTEIDHFDLEKERIILLCSKSFIIVKYNFIAMKQEEFRRIDLSVVDKIVVGELVYPERSLTPRIGGVAGGLFGVVKDCIIPRVQVTVQSVGNVILYRNSKSSTTATSDIQHNQLNAEVQEQPQPQPVDNYSKETPKSALSFENFEPRTRNAHGIRIMWNQDVPLTFSTKWNPFTKSIPWITLTSHPLLWHKGGGSTISQSFDIDSFSRELIDILSHNSTGGDSSPMCRVEYKTIVMDSYVGLPSLFHNVNELGFYKVRGKLSF